MKGESIIQQESEKVNLNRVFGVKIWKYCKFLHNPDIRFHLK